MKRYGLSASPVDQFVYYRHSNDIIILAIWVDDGLLCSNSKSHREDAINYLAKNLSVTFGPINSFVGLKIIRNRERRTISISQKHFILQTIDRFNMSDSNPKSIPADPHTHLLSGPANDENYSSSFPYGEAVGCLMYIMSCSRPDIALALRQVSQFCSNPTTQHWGAVKQILTYLKGTANLGVQFGGKGELNTLVAYSDSDHARDVNTRRSTSGYTLMMNNGPLVWRSQRQTCVSLSTTEAEYVAMSEGIKDIIWLRQLLADIGHSQRKSTIMHCDNQSAIQLVMNPDFHRRTKHTEVRRHFIREKQKDGTASVVYLSTQRQIADILTKPLSSPDFKKFRQELGMDICE